MEQYSQENPLFDLLYILRGATPTHPFLFHHIFQYFDKDQKLAIKLCRKLMDCQDCNSKNQNGHTPLQIAVIYNQKAAIRYAQQDGRFDFNDQTLMSLAIIHAYFEIVEILLFDEGLSVMQANLRMMNSQSAINLKILKRFEKLEIQQALNEDTFEYQEIIVNRIPQFPIPKTPSKIIIETIDESLIPTAECIEEINQESVLRKLNRNGNFLKQSSCQDNQIYKQKQKQKTIELQEHRVSYNNLFRCENFVQQLLCKIFQFKYPQLDLVMLLFLQKGYLDCYYKNLDSLIEQMLIPIPTEQSNSDFDQTKKIDNYCREFIKEITQNLNGSKQQLQRQRQHFNNLKVQNQSKLKSDVSYQSNNQKVLINCQDLLLIYKGLFQILHKPYMNIESCFFILEQFELINKLDMIPQCQLMTADETISTNVQ
ncbi:unnamed protein product (macronuclear) [Paramecium tetraurelia]|uniref:Uncharacterized protein n=1 Tax=Paramecium tetraurelia TaxID=5888 RepID=A0E3D1_PARTE|nr:uncharacterized protein GSPATT00022971001 [Paramecium tetraurelia]CAK89798.1 unnamed protein product [Paramecium tetraurelia]|eukprot:XP_001457195.1 hypothetical protein (macronuclear) [Paramecium tetraurelia strain d4-2]